MNKCSKYNDINAVMDKAEKSIIIIEGEYQKYLRGENIPESLLVEIKDCLSNLRSALDYLWCKIPGVSDGHFPVANSVKDIASKVVGLENKYICALEKFQSYNKDSWIRNFNLFRNKNTHLTLIPQKRIETKEFSVKKTGTEKIMTTFRGCTFGGNGNHISISGVPMPIDLKTQFPVDTRGLDIERKIWVDFLFDGAPISLNFPRGISVLPFLKDSLENVKKIIFEIEQLI
jgi:hypothetical protein